MSDESNSLIGTTFDDYEIVAELGEGGMGEVYVAFQSSMQREVAVKFMSKELAQSQPLRERFRDEIRSAAAISHPGIVEIYDCGQYGERPYFVMERMHGESLSTRLSEVGLLPWRDAVRISLQIARALAAAHDHDAPVVHRDLKPSNVFIVADDEVAGQERIKLLDFGIAKTDGSSKTQTGDLLGTPEYMSPEQCKGAKNVDNRSDLYSLGCIMYQMLSGHPPFEAFHFREVMQKHINEQPQPIRKLNPDIPHWLSVVVHRLLHKDPSNRFKSASRLVAALSYAKQDRSDPAAPRPGRMWKILTFILIFGALVVATIGFWPRINTLLKSDRPIADPSTLAPGLSLESYAQLCNQQSGSSACYVAGNLAESQRAPDLAEEYFEMGCNRSSVSSCFRLGRITQKRDYSSAALSFATACRLGHNPSCAELAFLDALEPGLVGDSLKAEVGRATSAECSMGNGRACFVSAKELTDELGGDVDGATSEQRELLRSLLAKACADEVAAACHSLGVAYRRGTLSASRLEIALHYFRKGCLTGHKPSCREADSALLLFRWSVSEIKCRTISYGGGYWCATDVISSLPDGLQLRIWLDNGSQKDCQVTISEDGKLKTIQCQGGSPDEFTCKSDRCTAKFPHHFRDQSSLRLTIPQAIREKQ